MKQLLQRLDDGATTIVDVPVPAASGVNLLVESRTSLISAGTERMLVEFGRSNLLAKARSQPEKVKQVFDKIRTDGLMPTVEAVRAKLDAPIPLGYCHAGVVAQVGERVSKFRTGDRIVTNGSHAEYARVAETLAARIPEGVSFDAAAFTPLAAIGLEGIRLAAPSIGETVVVYGLGLIGLLTAQLLRANGCRVIGIDRDDDRLELAARFGAVTVDAEHGDVAAHVQALTGGVGADAVLLTLASDSDEPVRHAAAMSRKRGRLILVGVSGLNLVRDDFYKKELSFAVSCSYGPGRYDPSYEEAALDYPLPYVRWTEQRNFEAILTLMGNGQLDPLPLISHRFDFENAPAAYDVVRGSEPSLGIILKYADRGGLAPAPEERTIVRRRTVVSHSAGVVGIIGAGNFSVRTLLPALRVVGAKLHTVASSGGTSGAVAAAKFGIDQVTTDVDSILSNEEIDTVFVLTRHDSHASLALRALEAGKHVFVEKPLALCDDDIAAMEKFIRRSDRLLTVGFNRRFAPLTDRVTERLAARVGPASVIMTVNAGAIPREHWTQDPVLGGGRVVGEASHFIDLARHLIGSPIVDMVVVPARNRQGMPIDDIAHVTISFADGSAAVVHYLANGSANFPKERIECFFDGNVLVIENWRRLRLFGIREPVINRRRKIDKGHLAEIATWMRAVRDGGSPPIPYDQLFEVSRWAIQAGRLARAGALGERPGAMVGGFGG